MDLIQDYKYFSFLAEVLGMRFKGIKREDVLKRISAKLTSAKKTLAKKNNEIVPFPLSSEDKKLKMVQIGSITIRKTNSN
jgi:hypothetical protein